LVACFLAFVFTAARFAVFLTFGLGPARFAVFLALVLAFVLALTRLAAFFLTVFLGADFAFVRAFLRFDAVFFRADACCFRLAISVSR
jgi:hypothetical protein